MVEDNRSFWLPEEMAAYRQSFQRREQSRFQAGETRRKRARQAIHNAIQSIAPHYVVVRRVYLFGSITRPGTFSPRSDIDLGIDGGDMALCFKLWRALEKIIQDWPLDVRQLRNDDLFSERVRLKRATYEMGFHTPRMTPISFPNSSLGTRWVS